MIRFLRSLMGGRQTEALPSRYLDTPLLMVSPEDSLSIGDLCEGTAVFGGTGSGKTSGSGKALSECLLSSGFGGLVLTAKPDERQLWEGYARASGREDQLLVISPENPYRFNFLDYALNRPGVGAGLSGNIVSLFMQVMEVAEKDRGGKDESYWQRTTRQLLRNSIDLLALARGRITLQEIYDIIISAPMSPEAIHDANWQSNSLCFHCLAEAKERDHELPPERSRDLSLTASYFLEEFPALAEKTRSVIVSSFTSMADGFLRYPLRELFCTDTTIVPELAEEGMIILLDLPVKEYEEIGRFAQVLFKLLFQQSMERRTVKEDTPPVFLWADEAHYFVTESDILFQTTARSSRVCTVYLTQNRGNLESTFGGQNAKAQADALLGSLLLKVWHANDHVDTNTWASETIGRTVQFRASSGASTSQGQPGGNSVNTGLAEQIEFQVTPHRFTTLRTGGPRNDLVVDALMFKQGRIWVTSDANYLPVSFRQG